jgi:PQQ-dependent catabolism-associated beta-propeller protein
MSDTGRTEGRDQSQRAVRAKVGAIRVRAGAAAAALLGLAACNRLPPAPPHLVFVSDETGPLHVIDGRTLQQTQEIAVGRRPRGLALSPDGATLYVAVSNDNRIAMVDVKSRRVRGYVVSGPDPERFALSPDGRMLYVSNERDAKVSAVDLASDRIVRQTEVGSEPEGIAVSPDGRWVICTSEAASLVHFIDAATGALADSVLVGARPRAALFSPDGRRLWVSSEARASLAVFDMATRKVIHTIDFRKIVADPAVQAVGLARTRDGRRIYVALGRGDRVAEVDAESFRVLRTFPTGHRTWGIALSPDEGRLYAANGLSGNLTVIDLASGHERALNLGGRPWGVETAR